MIRTIAILASCATFGGCMTQQSTTPTPTATASLEASVINAYAAAPMQLPPNGRSLLTLSDSPSTDTGWPVRRVHERRYADGLQQTLELARPTPGLPSNAIDVRLRRTADVAGLEGIAMEPPTEAMIQGELATQFARMQMRVVEQPRRNRLGVYGLAVGYWANGARCIYAWQWIDDASAAGLPQPYTTAAIRVRLCGSGMTLDTLAQSLDQLQFNTSPHAPPILASAPDTTQPRKARRPTMTQRPRTAKAWRQPAAQSTPASDDSWSALRRRETVLPATNRVVATPPAAMPTSDLPLAALRGPNATQR